MENAKNIKYLKYKKIKGKLNSFSYGDIKLSHLAAFNIAYMVYFFREMSAIEKVKLVLNFAFFIPGIKKIKRTKKALFGWSFDRVDYNFLAQAYKEKLGWDFDNASLSFDGCGKRVRFDVRSLLYSINIARKVEGLTISERFVVLFSVYKAVSFLNLLEKSFSVVGLEKYLSFNSSFDYESILTLFLRDKKIATYSMQHGMYLDYKGDIPFDVINYENVTAEHLLVWGGFTQEQIKNYLPEHTQCIVFGHPLYSGSVKNCFNEKSKKILVGLPRGMYQQEIENLVLILKDQIFSEFYFILRVHPDNNRKYLERIIADTENIVLSVKKSLSDDLVGDQYCSFIGFNSTVLFEATRYGLPVFQYISGNDEFYGVGFGEFDSPEGLLRLLQVKLSDNECFQKTKYFN